MATLKEYLEQENLTQAEFAEMIEESIQNVSRWVNGERLPQKERMIRIDSATEGKVSFADWYREHAGASP